jgi:hypothetical protein
MLLARWLFGMALLGLMLQLPPAPAGAESGTEARVERMEALVRAARFREAAEQTPALRRAVLALPPSPSSRQLLVRTELAAGTAALALGHDSNAKDCFLRALRVEPDLALASDTAPKVRHTVDALREVRE